VGMVDIHIALRVWMSNRIQWDTKRCSKIEKREFSDSKASIKGGDYGERRMGDCLRRM
jgi:hypothetical protein